MKSFGGGALPPPVMIIVLQTAGVNTVRPFLSIFYRYFSLIFGKTQKKHSNFQKNYPYFVVFF